MSNDPLKSIEEFEKQYGGICKYFYFGEPVVLVHDADLVEYLLNTNAKNFTKER